MNKKIAVIGCGDWGKNIARTLSELGALRAVVDAHQERSAQFAAQHGVCAAPLEQILFDSAIEGCTISVPTPAHFSVAKACLEAGKHVFLEKPFCAQIEQAEALKSLAREKKLVLMVGHLLRYHQAFRGLVEQVHAGRIGRVLSVHASRKNLGKIFLHEGVVWDMGPHDVSMMLALFKGQKPKCVFMQGKALVTDHVDEAVLSLDYADSMATIYLSRLSYKKEQKFVVVGSEGTLVFDDTLPWDQKVICYESFATKDSLQRDERGTALIFNEPESPLKSEMLHFLRCIETDQDPRSGAEEAIKTLEILSAAQKSCQSGQWVVL